ncbi:MULTISPECIES: signal peptidase I [Staphylococcus]|uniref:signal peptidase I n=1 Tax=Staphylococcus TaxID=1279 RepID=UPI0021CFE45F|nr:signal peptidase I [Staphylococcus sp. IVB6181]UXV34425.1 signal peptidase I [Staphylococcus sp. IVB6181]
MRKIVKYLLSVIIAIIIVMLIQAFIIIGAVVKTDNMAPVLNKDDRILVSKVQAAFNQIHNSDVIMYRHNGHTYFGRVIGTPGESVEYKDGQLFRDDQLVKERYDIKNPIQNLALRDLKHSEGDILAPKHYLVLNDNRAQQQDSRQFGTIHQKDIIGKVVLRYYPFQQFKISFNE